MSKEIFSQLKEVVKEVKPSAEVTSTSEFQKDLGFDSLDNMSMLFEVEKVFKIKIPDADINVDNFSSIPRMVSYLERRLNS